MNIDLYQLVGWVVERASNNKKSCQFEPHNFCVYKVASFLVPYSPFTPSNLTIRKGHQRYFYVDHS